MHVIKFIWGKDIGSEKQRSMFLFKECGVFQLLYEVNNMDPTYRSRTFFFFCGI